MLSEINFANNPLKALKANLFSDCPSLQYLYVSSASVLPLCDVSLAGGYRTLDYCQSMQAPSRVLQTCSSLIFLTTVSQRCRPAPTHLRWSSCSSTVTRFEHYLPMRSARVPVYVACLCRSVSNRRRNDPFSSLSLMTFTSVSQNAFQALGSLQYLYVHL